jgi:hypothetical protein
MQKVDAEETCTWKQDVNGDYDTDCGDMFTFIDSGPKENHMKFCCYCGKPIKEEPCKK